jgi:SAM-dependent methyltransferase
MRSRVFVAWGYCPRMSGSVFWRQHGDTWARRSEHGLPNAAYDRPAILRLAGDVTGRCVLELGCAAGVLTRQLVDRGASVLALDREPRMADLARQRLGGRARVEVADVEQPLDMVPDASIDLVVAALVLHYIEDWRPLLGELHRCLVPGGALVFRSSCSSERCARSSNRRIPRSGPGAFRPTAASHFQLTGICRHISRRMTVHRK